MKIGLLPFYLELYDRVAPKGRIALEIFYQAIAALLRKHAIDVLTAPLCRLAPEFQRAITNFERAGADAIITLHLAYSPSLESINALAGTNLPLIIFDTTPDKYFGPRQTRDAIMHNHGIHGVQDMCNMLLRRQKPFAIVAGHWQTPQVQAHLGQEIRAAVIASRLRKMRVGQIGPAFKGMGDFCVPETVLRKKIGLEIVKGKPSVFQRLARQIKANELKEAQAALHQLFNFKSNIQEALWRSLQAGLIIRRWLADEKLGAFTINFLAAGKSSGLPTMPFLEAGLAMARGIGYAGEGDVLTAAIIGALYSVFPGTTFAEMFCPDWQGNRIFLSHMGEWNVRLAAKRPTLIEYNFIFGKAPNPVLPEGCLKSGPALFVNLAPLAGGKFRLIAASGCMEAPRGRDNLDGTVRGWFRPALKIADFLAEYSRVGGTHHAALVYDGDEKILTSWAKHYGWEFCKVG